MKVRQCQREQALGVCGSRCGNCNYEPSNRDSFRGEKAPGLHGCRRVRETDRSRMGPQERVARRLRCVAIAEVDANDAESVSSLVGAEARDLHVSESRRPFRGEDRRGRDPFQWRRQFRDLGEHRLYIGVLLRSDLALDRE
jgi:hypothetical protein